MLGKLSRLIKLEGRLRPLLELESASNDQMAIILISGCIRLLQTPGLPLWQLLLSFILQIIISATAGRMIVELEFPDSFLIILVMRDNEFMIPNARELLQGDDTLLVLSDALRPRRIPAEIKNTFGALPQR